MIFNVMISVSPAHQAEACHGQLAYDEQAVDQVSYYHHQPYDLHANMAEEIDLENCSFSKFRSSLTLTLTFDRVKVTLVRISGQGLPTPKIRLKLEKLCVRTTDGRTQLSSNLLGHRLAMTLGDWCVMKVLRGIV